MEAWKESFISALLYQADKGENLESKLIFEKSNKELVEYVNENYKDPSGQVLNQTAADGYITRFISPYDTLQEADRKLKIENGFLLLVYLVACA